MTFLFIVCIHYRSLKKERYSSSIKETNVEYNTQGLTQGINVTICYFIALIKSID